MGVTLEHLGDGILLLKNGHSLDIYQPKRSALVRDESICICQDVCLSSLLSLAIYLCRICFPIYAPHISSPLHPPPPPLSPLLLLRPIYLLLSVSHWIKDELDQVYIPVDTSWFPLPGFKLLLLCFHRRILSSRSNTYCKCYPQLRTCINCDVNSEEFHAIHPRW